MTVRMLAGGQSTYKRLQTSLLRQFGGVCKEVRIPVAASPSVPGDTNCCERRCQAGVGISLITTNCMNGRYWGNMVKVSWFSSF